MTPGPVLIGMSHYLSAPGSNVWKTSPVSRPRDPSGTGSSHGDEPQIRKEGHSDISRNLSKYSTNVPLNRALPVVTFPGAMFPGLPTTHETV